MASLDKESKSFKYPDFKCEVPLQRKYPKIYGMHSTYYTNHAFKDSLIIPRKMNTLSNFISLTPKRFAASDIYPMSASVSLYLRYPTSDIGQTTSDNNQGPETKRQIRHITLI